MRLLLIRLKEKKLILCYKRFCDISQSVAMEIGMIIKPYTRASSSLFASRLNSVLGKTMEVMWALEVFVQ